jgi:hypothetical protein
MITLLFSSFVCITSCAPSVAVLGELGFVDISVDTVKIMSNCLQKHTQKNKTKQKQKIKLAM